MDKQELPINNPAERLYVILTRAAKIFSGRNNSGKSNNFVFAFCFAMNLDVSDDNFITGLTELLKLVENIEQKIKQYFPVYEQESYLTLTKEIRNYLVATITRRYSESNNEFIEKNTEYLFKSSKSNLSILEVFKACAGDFQEYGIKYGISFNKDLLNELINDIDAWLVEIQKSEFDESVKEFLISTFMEINNLLEKYYDCGSQRIETEILAAIAKITLYSKNLTAENKSIFDKSSEKLFKMLDLFIKPATAYVLGEKLFSEAIRPIMTEVIDKVQHFLPPGS
jgi:hypothetical protein